MWGSSSQTGFGEGFISYSGLPCAPARGRPVLRYGLGTPQYVHCSAFQKMFSGDGARPLSVPLTTHWIFG
jgi:hypothetical protein